MYVHDHYVRVARAVWIGPAEGGADHCAVS
jgi:hypothetical protein